MQSFSQKQQGMHEYIGEPAPHLGDDSQDSPIESVKKLFPLASSFCNVFHNSLTYAEFRQTL